MSFPDKCPNCGAVLKVRQFHNDRMIYACESWIKAGLEKLTWKSDTCCDWRTIREAAAIIREMMDEWGNAMDSAMLEKAKEWLKDNTP